VAIEQIMPNLLPQRDRHRGRHRFGRQRATLEQIAPDDAARNRQRHVVQLAAGLLGQRLGL